MTRKLAIYALPVLMIALVVSAAVLTFMETEDA
jgi:hypothetical protein